MFESRWLDETPVSRIIQRLTLDIDVVDSQIMRELSNLEAVTVGMIIHLASAVLFVPLFTLPGFFVACMGMYVGSRYLKVQLSCRREMR